MTDPKTVPETPPVAVDPPAKAPAAAPERQAVLLKASGALPPGRIVRGPAAAITKLITTGIARQATPADIEIAGGRSVRLPRGAG